MSRPAAVDGSRHQSISVRAAGQADGATLWGLARDVGLDENSPYAYLLFGEYFSATTLIADDGTGSPAGFVMGFVVPDRPDTVFVWQVGVAARATGHGVASMLLDELVARTSARALEATVTPGNDASAALFGSLARRHGATLDHAPLFGADRFPGDHPAEIRFRITALR